MHIYYAAIYVFLCYIAKTHEFVQLLIIVIEKSISWSGSHWI